MLGIYLINLKEVYLKPKFTFSPASNIEIRFGLDLFSGEKSRSGLVAIEGRPTDLQFVAQSTQFIGNFKDNDRIFMEFKYSF